MSFRSIVLGWRNIRKNGIYSVINIVGLSLGMAVVALILFWVADEFSYNKSHKNLDRIYTVYEHQQYSDGNELFTSCTPCPLSQTLAKYFAEVQCATTYLNLNKLLIRFGDKEYKEGPVICADSSFLKIFSYEVIEGDRNTLSTPDQIMITEELAQLFFQSQSPIGKVLTFNNEHSFTIGAVIASPKQNLSMNFKILAPIEILKKMGVNITQWGNNWPNTYILLAKDASSTNLSSKIINVCKENGQPNTTLHLFPYKNERLYSYSGKSNRIQYVYQFLGIAFIIILIASINFINLSTAREEHRRPEMGVRKVMGAGKIHILNQLLQEKGMMIFMSMVVSGLLVMLFLPAFNSVSDKKLTFGLLQNSSILVVLFAVIVIIPFFSVVYPSVYLSSINPVVALKKSLNVQKRGMNLKNLLVVIQFTLAIILISGSVIITQQMKYINNYNLGYNKENLIFLSLDGDARKKHEAIRQEMSGLSGIESITRADKLPLYGGNSSWGHNWEGKDPENRVLICKMNVDRNYMKTMGIKLVDGSFFSERFDGVITQNEHFTHQVILNKEAIKRMGLKNPVGKEFSPWGDKKGTIIGVVEDFHFESLHNGVEPLLLLPLFENPAVIIMRVKSENFPRTIDEIKKSWTKILPQTKCELGFFDTRIEKLYTSEVKMSALFKYFTIIAIFISCIGLFGLSLFIIERRRKEIGIRKVTGARIFEVMTMLNRDFVKWVIIAFVIATPIAWYAMNKWLENFAYKTELSWWIFAFAGLLALGIAILTVSWQSWRAATRNPVEALRSE